MTGILFGNSAKRQIVCMLHTEVPGFKKGPGRARTNWRGIVKKDLRAMGRGGGGSSQQTRTTSGCGPISSRGRGMNQVKSSAH